MADQSISCPECGKKIPLTRAIRAEIEGSLKRQFDQDLAARERELQAAYAERLDADLARVQKDALNDWQASNYIPTEMVVVNGIDWGDNLESVPWYINSRVRIETVLYDVVQTPLTEYTMLHTAGWGIDEQWGLSMIPGTPDIVETIENYMPTVYSTCSRLTRATSRS